VGYDAGKKVKGRKIHALVDTEGLRAPPSEAALLPQHTSAQGPSLNP
jgi:hypothetical protein